MIITIDGYAGTGKSTIGRKLADNLNCFHLSSGNIYRTLSWYVIHNKLLVNSLSDNKILEKIDITILDSDNIIINKIALSINELRSKEINNLVFEVSKIQNVRDYVSGIIRKIATNSWLVIDGRDIGSIVLPNADFKFFFVADIDERCKGRPEIKSDILLRDENDSNRKIAPLTKPKNSIQINSFELPIENLVSQLTESIKKNIVFCESDWLIDSTIDLSSNNKNILVVDRPMFENLETLKNADLVIFKDELNELSHEVMMFKDFQIPYIHVLNSEYAKITNRKIRINTYPDKGYIAISDLLNETFVAEKKVLSDNVLVSCIEGMKYYSKHPKVKDVATRGEFMFLQLLKSHPLYAINNGEFKILQNHIFETVSFGASHFDNILYRFTDFSLDNLYFLSKSDNYEKPVFNPSIGDRGTYRLNTFHKDVFLFEIMNIATLQKQYQNISVILPFVRSFEEANQAVDCLKDNSIINIGCMIEVPSILYYTEQIDPLFDFFVVGLSDFSQLIQGSDRNLFAIKSETLLFITDLLCQYFFPKISKEKKVYITSKTIYENLINKNISNNILCLSK